MTGITNRLVEFAFKPIEEVYEWLSQFPHLTVTLNGDKTIWVQHEDGFRCAILESAPLDQGISLAIAMLGFYWSHAVPGLTEKIDQEFHRRKQEAK